MKNTILHCDVVPVLMGFGRLGFVQRIDWANQMSDKKHLNWAEDLRMDTESTATESNNEIPAAANDADGWAQYRQWITKAPAPRGRRTGIDPALYTWKGYRNWTEQVRRSWSPESEEDSD